MLRALQRQAHRTQLVARLMETWFRRPEAPTRLVLDVTRRCNLRCETCRTWEAPRAHELSPEEVSAILRQMPGLFWLDVTGGEPFLRKDAAALFDAITASTPALRVLHFPTNGWFTRRVLAVSEAIVKQRPDVELIVTVSLDGPPAVHDQVRGVAGSFERAFETLRRLREMDGVSVYVGTTIGHQNRAHVEELGTYLREHLPRFSDAE